MYVCVVCGVWCVVMVVVVVVVVEVGAGLGGAGGGGGGYCWNLVQIAMSITSILIAQSFSQAAS